VNEPYVQYLDPPSAGGPARAGDLREEYGPVTVPPNQYFMMGDNRDNSEDSRYWGFMPASYVKGKALFIYYSFDDSGSIASIFQSTRWGRILDPVR
jgi:signal peptidase I